MELYSNDEENDEVCIMCYYNSKVIKGELYSYFLYSLLYFNEVLIVVVVSRFLKLHKLHNVWLQGYSAVKYSKFK